MRHLIFSTLILLSACSLNSERAESPTSQRSPELLKLLESANRLDKLQRAAQPESWDVSIEESMTKENPFAPPDFIINGEPPPKGYQSDAGLWNCQKLEVGHFLCSYDSEIHMIAQYFAEEQNGKVTGQVGVFGPGNHLLVAYCKESGGVGIEINWRYFDASRYKGRDFEIGFDSEPVEDYQFRVVKKSNRVITDNKKLLAQLMNDYTAVKVRSLPVGSTPVESTRFIVKNFPNAWAVACGWHPEYDAISGIR